MAFGHPIGVTGTPVLTPLSHLLQECQVRRGLCALCLGGGKGIALIAERV
ncbi:MAG: hypothetical protein ACE10F_03890 [Candidatus Methylomirabilales bacterium]|nr:hypothetical protein [candidate division NC10 bacterium]